MKWSEYKESLKDELEFYKRNPFFPILFIVSVALNIYIIFK